MYRILRRRRIKYIKLCRGSRAVTEKINIFIKMSIGRTSVSFAKQFQGWSKSKSNIIRFEMTTGGKQNNLREEIRSNVLGCLIQKRKG